MANPSPQHTPTDGLGTPNRINLSGTGVTAIVTGQQYQVSLNVGGSPNPATVALTGTLKDIAGSTFTSGNGNSISWVSYNTNVATVNGGGTVTAVAKGQAVIEGRFPTFDTTDGTDFVYVQLLVNVGA
jgi:hypothetical protein